MTAIDGINALTALTLVAEVGLDMSRFPSEAHLVSYLGLSPSDKKSGGKKVGWEKRKKSRAGQALQFAAGSLRKADCYLGAQFRRLVAKLGPAKARKAMGAKLARIFYRLMKYGEAYLDKGTQHYETTYRQQQLLLLAKKAHALGFDLVKAA